MRHAFSVVILVLAATACGGDSATNAPLIPVASVSVTGPERVKVGDQYQLAVESRTADGTVVTRPAPSSASSARSGS